MNIRKYNPADINEILNLFYDSVHCVCTKDYTTEQLNAWADRNVNADKWNDLFNQHYTLVVHHDHRIVGFGDIDDTGYLDKLYVHKDYQKLGVGSLICDALEQYNGENTTTVHSSISAKTFFERRGYIVVCKQEVFRNGVSLINYKMQKKV